MPKIVPKMTWSANERKNRLGVGYEMEVGKRTETSDEEPLFKCLPLRSLDGKIDRQAEERISKPVVCGGLSGYDMS